MNNLPLNSKIYYIKIVNKINRTKESKQIGKYTWFRYIEPRYTATLQEGVIKAKIDKQVSGEQYFTDNETASEYLVYFNDKQEVINGTEINQDLPEAFFSYGYYSDKNLAELHIKKLEEYNRKLDNEVY